jgi:hypothetical protein
MAPIHPRSGSYFKQEALQWIPRIRKSYGIRPNYCTDNSFFGKSVCDLVYQLKRIFSKIEWNGDLRLNVDRLTVLAAWFEFPGNQRFFGT